MKNIRKGILLCLLGAFVCFLLSKRILTADNALNLVQEFYGVNSDVAFSQKATSFYSRVFISEEIRDPYFLMSPLLMASDKAHCEDFEAYYDEESNEILVISQWKTNSGKYYDVLDSWTLRDYLIIDKNCEYCIERR